MERTEAVRHELAGPIIHWSAVLGGSFVAMGAWLFLLTLGTAINGQATATTWTAVYMLVSPIIALFFGGLLAARSRLLVSRFDATLHGVVIWGFTMTIGALLMGMLGGIFISGRAGAAMPSGYSWAVAGSILGSLIASLLGAATASSRQVVRHEVPREVNP